MINETFDAPTAKQGEALVWLQVAASKFEATVKRQLNPHDFGEYPSFELYAEEPHDIDSCLQCEDGSECEDYNKDPDNTEYYKLWDSINALHKAYYKKFEKWL